MKKKVIAILISALVLFSMTSSIIFALNSNGSEGILYYPKDEFSKALSNNNSFENSLFQPEIKYIGETYYTANRITMSDDSVYFLGNDGNGATASIMMTTDSSRVIDSHITVNRGENRVVFTAPHTGTYSVIPLEIEEGNEAALCFNDTSLSDDAQISFWIVNGHNGNTVYSKTFTNNVRSSTIKTEDNNNICFDLIKGEKIYFYTNIVSENTADDNLSTILQMNFAVSFNEESKDEEIVIYDPAEYITAEEYWIRVSSLTRYESNIYRADSAYTTRYYDRMTEVEKTNAGVTVGNVTLNYNNWNRYCAFMVKTNRTSVVSKMSTGVNQSNNRLVFMAPYAGYYEISPRKLHNQDGSVYLDLGSHVSDFGNNTANFKIFNAQTNEVYTDITLYAANEDGESNFTGEIENTQNIYLKKGEKIYITTSTTVDWFDYDHKQTVFVEFDFGIVLKEIADIQTTYTLSVSPMDLFNSEATGDTVTETESFFTVKTKYYGDTEYEDANTTRRFDENKCVLGNNDRVNWDKYASMTIDRESGMISANLVNKGSGAQIVFTAPQKGIYQFVPKTLPSGNFIELDLGNSADKFSDTDNVEIKISGDENTTITLTKANPTASLSEMALDMESGETFTVTIETNSEWFDEPEYQTVTVNMSFAFVTDITNNEITKTATYNPNSQIAAANADIEAGDIDYINPTTLNYDGYEFSTISRYYSINNTQVGYRYGPNIHLFGVTWDTGRELRGSIEYNELSDRITGVMGMSEENKCIQTVRFTAPSDGYYSINPVALGMGESGWLKCTNANSSNTLVQMKIHKNLGELIYESGPIGRYEAIVSNNSIVIYLDAGETLDFNLSALSTEWNTNPRLSVKFDISKLDLSL